MGRSLIFLLVTFASLVAGSMSIYGQENVGNSSGAASLRFDFGSGPTQAKWTKVTGGMRYDSKRGFGFDLGTTPNSQKRDSPDPLHCDWVSSDRPFFFSVRLPEGNYRISVTLGGNVAASSNTVKAESRRLMLENVKAQPGQVEQQTFSVNIRTPQLANGKKVRLKPREIGVLHWDDKLTLEFNGVHPAVCALEITPLSSLTTVFLLGDSTVTDQPGEPWNSWGKC